MLWIAWLIAAVALGVAEAFTLTLAFGLLAAAALIAAIVGGIILFAIGLEAIGIAVFLASIPFAIGAWMTSNDRRL